jgi:hypothetical protein
VVPKRRIGTLASKALEAQMTFTIISRTNSSHRSFRLPQTTAIASLTELPSSSPVGARLRTTITHPHDVVKGIDPRKRKQQVC